MTPLSMAVVATTHTVVALMIVNLYLFRQDRREWSLYLALGWALFVVRLVFMYISLDVSPLPVFVLLTHEAALASAAFLIVGSYKLLGKEPCWKLFALIVLVGAWIAVAWQLDFRFVWLTAPPFFVLGLVHLHLGIAMIRTSSSRWSGQWVAGISFILWGIHKFDYPFLRDIEWFAPQGYLLSATLATIAGLGMLIAHTNAVQSRLRAHEERLSLLANSLHDPVVITDRDARITALYGTWFKADGIDTDAMVGRPLSELVGEQSMVLHRDAIARVFRGETTTYEWQDTADSEPRWFQITASPMYSPGGTIDGAVGTVQEITEIKLAQERLEKELLENQTLLQEIHHRVKNNMQVMASLLSLQSGRLRDPYDAKIVSESGHRIESMSVIHEQLYSADRLHEVPAEIFVHKLVERLTMIYPAAGGKIDVAVETEPMLLNVDKAIPLGQVLHELLSNSMKHGFPGGRQGRVVVRTRKIAPAHAELVVSDNGVGFGGETAAGSEATLGTRLIELLTAQLGGTLEVTNGVGVTTAVRFPLGRVRG